MLLVLLAALLLAAGAAASATTSPDDPDGTLRHNDLPVPTSIDEIAERLGDDPILVESVLGNGATAQARDRIRAVTDQSTLDVPVYVVMTALVPALNESDPAGDLAIRLHSRLGDGVYVVALSEGVIGLEAWGVPDELGLSAARYDALEAGHRYVDSERGLSTPAIVEMMATIAAAGPPWAYDDATVEQIASDPANWRPDTDRSDDTDGARTPGGRAMLATVAFLGTFLLGLRLVLWARSRGGSAIPATGPTVTDHANLRATAESALDRLVTRLRRVPSSERADAALHDRAAAETLLAAVDGPDRLAPDDKDGTRHLVGVLVLARAGLHELDDRRRGSDPGPYRPCFFNPLHGRATATIDFGRGGSALAVHACTSCRHAIARDRTPSAFVGGPTGLLGGRPQPYYTEDGLFADTAYGSTGTDFASDVIAAAGRKERSR
ncbi:UNVERIFIED_CONTAM: hypothetical protein LK11_16250 [Mumia flava]